MNEALQSYFEQVVDPRKPKGIRYSLPTFLTMLCMAAMSGNHGFRGIADFFKANEKALKTLFRLPRGVPKFSSIRTLLGVLDFNSVNAAFEAWSLSSSGVERGDFVSIDGKILGSTVKNVFTSHQDFTSVVSLFAQKQGIALGQRAYNRQGSSEIAQAQLLVEACAGRGLVFTMDALHCQKKQLPPSSTAETTTSSA